jgi:hypothetical protein
VVLSGTSLQASAPNVATVSTTSATRQTATLHGLQGYDGTASDYPVGSWDNFLVTTAAGGAAGPLIGPNILNKALVGGGLAH